MIENQPLGRLHPYHQNRRKRLCRQIASGSRTKRVSETGFGIADRRKPRTCRAQMARRPKSLFIEQYQLIRWRRGGEAERRRGGEAERRRGGEANPRYPCAQPQKCSTHSTLPVDCFGSARRQRYHQNRRKRLCHQITPRTRTKGVSATGFGSADLCKPRTCRAHLALWPKSLFIQ